MGNAEIKILPKLSSEWPVTRPVRCLLGSQRFDPESTLRKTDAVHCAVGLHVPSRKFTAYTIQYRGFVIINECRNAIVQTALSGGSRRESLRRLFLRITGSTAITEPE